MRGDLQQAGRDTQGAPTSAAPLRDYSGSPPGGSKYGACFGGLETQTMVKLDLINKFRREHVFIWRETGRVSQ